MLLREFFVVDFCLAQYWNILVGIFPSTEEVIVGFAAVLAVSLHGIRLGNTELRKWGIDVPPTKSAMAQEFRQLGGSLVGLSIAQIGLRKLIVSVQGAVVLKSRIEQVHG